MRISEMIERLLSIQAEVGDVPVAIADGLEVMNLNASDDFVFVGDVDDDGWKQKYRWSPEDKATLPARHFDRSCRKQPGTVTKGDLLESMLTDSDLQFIKHFMAEFSLEHRVSLDNYLIEYWHQLDEFLLKKCVALDKYLLDLRVLLEPMATESDLQLLKHLMAEFSLMNRVALNKFLLRHRVALDNFLLELGMALDERVTKSDLLESMLTDSDLRFLKHLMGIFSLEEDVAMRKFQLEIDVAMYKFDFEVYALPI